MTYRDDLEAQVQRSEALQRDLAEAQRDLEDVRAAAAGATDLERRAKDLEAELAAARRRIAELEPPVHAPSDATPSPSSAAEPTKAAGVVARRLQSGGVPWSERLSAILVGGVLGVGGGGVLHGLLHKIWSGQVPEGLWEWFAACGGVVGAVICAAVAVGES